MDLDPTLPLMLGLCECCITMAGCQGVWRGTVAPCVRGMQQMFPPAAVSPCLACPPLPLTETNSGGGEQRRWEIDNHLKCSWHRISIGYKYNNFVLHEAAGWLLVCTENFDKVIRDVSPVLVRRGSAAQILGLHFGQSHGTLGLQFKLRIKDC